MSGGARPATRKVAVVPMASLTVPASAIDSGMRLSEVKKSRLDTRPSRAGGTRRCSSVPQMTVAAWNVAPIAPAATTISHSAGEAPNSTRGTQPSPHSRFMTVR